MKLYAIHGPRAAAEGVGLEDVRAAKTGFSFAALIFGPLWLLARGLWLALIVYLALEAALVGLVLAGWLAPAAAGGLAGLAHLYLGLAGRALRVSARERGPRPLLDVVFAGSALEAEKLFLERALRPAAPLAPRRNSGAAPPDVIGLFPEPGR